MRNKIYQMVHVYEGNKLSVTYKWIMIFAIIVSLIPLTTKDVNPAFRAIEISCVCLFSLDYLLRWTTADYKFNNHHWSSFLKYPFRMISIIDMLSIFALFVSLTKLEDSIKLATALSVFRIVRIFRYSNAIRTILGILKKSKKPLIAVFSLAIGYILISAIVIFNVDPDSFKTFFDAVYWSTVSLTTVGYGDIYPVTVLGRAVAMVSSFLGIAIVALPAGIVTAEYMKTVNDKDE